MILIRSVNRPDVEAATISFLPRIAQINTNLNSWRFVRFVAFLMLGLELL